MIDHSGLSRFADSIWEYYTSKKLEVQHLKCIMWNIEFPASRKGCIFRAFPATSFVQDAECCANGREVKKGNVRPRNIGDSTFVCPILRSKLSYFKRFQAQCCILQAIYTSYPRRIHAPYSCIHPSFLYASVWWIQH